MNPGTYGLPLRSSVVARRRRRLRILAALSAVSIFGFVGWVAHEAWPQRAEMMAQVSSVLATPERSPGVPVPAPVSDRPVYRHSIVPGGAYSRAEVADAIENDAVVAAHYEDIDVEKLHAKRIDVPRAVYVSYRVGEKVYWTKNRVRLAAGETVLTDGEREIRARCGNLLSDVAQAPVAAEDPLAALDVADPAPEEGSSSMADARGPEGRLSHVPFPPGLFGANGPFAGGLGVAGAVTPPSMWMGGGSGGSAPYLPSSTGTNGTSLVVPLGSTPRTTGSGGEGGTGGGSKDGGPTRGGPTGGDGPTGGGPTGGDGPTGGGPTGGDGPGGEEDPPAFVPPTTPGDPETTTGSPVTTTTGDTDTTGDTGTDTTGDIIHTVPEPGALLLLGLGACGLASRAVRARRNRR